MADEDTNVDDLNVDDLLPTNDSAQWQTTVKRVSRAVVVIKTTGVRSFDTALANFPRIVGLREGRVAFDLPTAQVSRQQLRDLYAQHEDELEGPAPNLADPPARAAPPAAMHCR